MYDLNLIKSIPLEQIAQDYGIQLERKHGRLWGKLRDEKNNSFSIVPEKNLWYDFGSGKGGSGIDLVAEIEGITPTEAIRKLAERYNIKNEISKIGEWQPLTDSQYRELGIKPELATLNFNYDLSVHTPEQLNRWNEKYSIHIKELAQKYPTIYNKLLEKIAVKQIELYRETYKHKLNSFLDPKEDQKEFYKKWAEMDAEEINRKVDLLERAYKGNKSFSQLKVDVEKDFKVEHKQPVQEDLIQDKEIQKKIIKVYEQLGFPQAKLLTVDQAKALHELHMISGSESKYLPVDAIQDAHKIIGMHLENFERKYNVLIKEGKELSKDKTSPKYKEWEQKEKKCRDELNKLKTVFEKLDRAYTAIKEVNLLSAQQKAQIKIRQNIKQKNIELSL